jgi:predicted pyridoxine 5'-phosphate oxidase superfamily flavin-nucleotide-binding protein
MVELNEIKKLIEKKAIAFASVNYDNKKPHTVALEINKVDGNKLIITDNHMDKTVKNIVANPNVSIAFWNKELGYRIDGRAKYENKGENLDFVKSLKENKGYFPKGVVIVAVEEIKLLA